jgi:hypothetical protein
MLQSELEVSSVAAEFGMLAMIFFAFIRSKKLNSPCLALTLLLQRVTSRDLDNTDIAILTGGYFIIELGIGIFTVLSPYLRFSYLFSTWRPAVVNSYT